MRAVVRAGELVVGVAIVVATINTVAVIVVVKRAVAELLRRVAAVCRHVVLVITSVRGQQGNLNINNASMQTNISRWQLKIYKGT